MGLGASRLTKALAELAYRKRQQSFSGKCNRTFTFRQTVYALLDIEYEQPTRNSMLLSKGIAIFLMLLNMITVMIYCLESLPENYKRAGPEFQIIPDLCNIIFTLDFICRFLTCDDKMVFMKQSYNWIDIISILPFYLEVAWRTNSDLIELRRVFRVLRVLKATKYNTQLELVAIVLKESIGAIFLLQFNLCICVVIFSSALFIVESLEVQWFDEKLQQWVRADDYGEEYISPFQSIPHTMWWGVVTLTTLGYGNDDVPLGISGKLIAALCMYAATFVVALPIVEITYKNNKVRAIYRDQERLLEITSTTNRKLNHTVDDVDIRKGSPVCTVKYNHKLVTVTYDGKVGKLHQLRYPALFTVGKKDDDVTLRSNPAIGQYLLMIRVCLDSDEMQQLVAKAVTDQTRLFKTSGVTREMCFAKQLQCIVLQIPHLPDEFKVTTPEFHSPSSSEICVIITAKSHNDLERLRHLISVLPLHFFGYERSKGSAPEVNVTVHVPHWNGQAVNLALLPRTPSIRSQKLTLGDLPRMPSRIFFPEPSRDKPFHPELEEGLLTFHRPLISSGSNEKQS